MAYTFLNSAMQNIGTLTNKGGQVNNYWGDSISHSIASSNDVLTSVSLTVDIPNTDIDTSGNQKQWDHTIQGLSFGIDGIGKNITEMDYLVYQDGGNGHYYMMTITQVDESVTQSGFHQKTIQGLNSAAYDLSRKTLRAQEFRIVPQPGEQRGSVQNILQYLFGELGWDVRAIGSFKDIDYSISEGATAQSALQDILQLFDAEVDAYVLLNNLSSGSNIFTGGGTIKRVFEFRRELGEDNGETVRLNRNMVSLTKTGARDALYTKLFVTGGDGITIGPANGGIDYIYDDVANKQYNTIGANSTPVQYLEGIITNSSISEPRALLEWAEKQLQALNHPRYNYTVGAVDGKNVHIGDTIIIQDLKASEPIILQSRIISKTISFADPQTDSFVLGEFSPIVMKSKDNKNDELVIMINNANQTAQDAINKADDAQQTADEAKEVAGEIGQAVDGKIQEVKDYADELDAKQKENIDEIQARNQAALDEAKKEREEIVINTDKMISDANKNLEDAKKELGDKVTANTTAITNTEKELGTKVSQSDYDKKTGELSSQITSVSQKADGLEVTVAKNKEEADGKISSNTSSINAMTDSLKLKVDKSEWNANNKLVEADIAQIKIDADKISQDVVKMDGEVKTNTSNITQTSKQITTEIQDRITGDKNVTTNLTNLIDQRITGVTTGYESAIQQSSDAITAGIASINYVVDSSLTEERKLWRPVDQKQNPTPADKWYYSSGGKYKGVPSLAVNTSGNDGIYSQISSQLIPKSVTNTRLEVGVDVYLKSSGGTSSDYLIVYLFELDKDMKSIASTSITGTLGGTKGVGVDGKTHHYEKTIDLNENTAYVQLTYQNRGNANAYVYRPYIGATKLPEGMYVPGPVNTYTTNLQLLKDSWSLGIKDNTGALISGINGDESGVRLAGDKIILDGKVTVTDDFYAKGGNFKNLNADELKTGSINTELIKIVNEKNDTGILLANGLFITNADNTGYYIGLTKTGLDIADTGQFMTGNLDGKKGLVIQHSASTPAGIVLADASGYPYVRFSTDRKRVWFDRGVTFNDRIVVQDASLGLKTTYVSWSDLANEKMVVIGGADGSASMVLKNGIAFAKNGKVYAFNIPQNKRNELNW